MFPQLQKPLKISSLTELKVEAETSVGWFGCCLTPLSVSALKAPRGWKWVRRSQRGQLQPLRGGRHFSGALRGGTQSVHWYSRIWPSDNRDVTEVKTAGPLQIMPGRKARGSPVPPTHLHSVVMVIKSVQYHYVTLMWAHSFFLPLWFRLCLFIVLLHQSGSKSDFPASVTMPRTFLDSPRNQEHRHD